MAARPLVFMAFIGLAALARSEEAPTDALLKLIPADAGAVLAVDDLRGRWADLAGSALAKDVQALPAFQAWLGSPSARDFFRARDEILGFLRTSHGEIRDELLGDAALLAILPPEDPAHGPSLARGLLALKARNPELLRRLVNQVDSLQKQNGELASVAEAKRGEVAYSVRRYPDATGQAPEAYVLFPDGVFVFSNSEAAVLDAIDRKSGDASGPSFVEAPGFAEAAAALAGHPMARAFVDPEFLRRAIDEQPPVADPAGRPIIEAIRGRLGDLGRIAAALEIDGGKIQVRLLQAFKPAALRRPEAAVFAPLRPAEGRADRPGPRMLSLPDTAVAAASFRIDAPAAYSSFVALIPEQDRPRAAKLEAIADALLLGRGLRSRILPALGPRAIAYLDAPDPSAPRLGNFPLPIVASIEIDEDDPGSAAAGPPGAATAEALDNALRATLAALALDEKRVPATARVTTSDDVTSLDVPYPFAYSIDRHGRRLTVGTSAASIARYLQAGARTSAGERFRSIRAAGFADFDSFACADLAALGSLAERHKGRLAAAAARRDGRPPEDVARDLDQLLAAARLFDAAFVAARFDEPAGVIEHRLGLLVRPPVHPVAAP